MGWTSVDGGQGSALDRSADVAVAPDGTLYVTWVTNGDNVRLARSTDGGRTFEPSVLVEGSPIAPIVGMARHPRVVADDARVAVVFNDQDALDVYLYVASVADLVFGAPIPIGTDVGGPGLDFPKALFLADGSVGVAFHGYPPTGAAIFWAREGNGFVSQIATGGAPGVPCECCPIELVPGDAGAVMLAYRNNVSNARDMWLAQAAQPSAFSSWVQVSDTEDVVPQCPMQGPRLVQTSATDHAMVWSARDTSPGAAMIASSTDGGGSWSGGAPIAGLVADEPTIAIGSSGTLYVTGVTGNMESSIVTSADGGASWTDPQPLLAPDGELSTPQAIGGGVAVLAGVSQASNVWLLRME
jgi:hypothetical protein